MKERAKNILIESKLTPQTSNIVTVQTKAHSLSEMKHERCNMNKIRDERMAIGSEKKMRTPHTSCLIAAIHI